MFRFFVKCLMILATFALQLLVPSQPVMAGEQERCYGTEYTQVFSAPEMGPGEYYLYMGMLPAYANYSIAFTVVTEGPPTGEELSIELELQENEATGEGIVFGYSHLFTEGDLDRYMRFSDLYGEWSETPLTGWVGPEVQLNVMIFPMSTARSEAGMVMTDGEVQGIIEGRFPWESDPKTGLLRVTIPGQMSLLDLEIERALCIRN